jgi:hypothetical protein
MSKNLTKDDLEDLFCILINPTNEVSMPTSLAATVIFVLVGNGTQRLSNKASHSFSLSVFQQHPDLDKAFLK